MKTPHLKHIRTRRLMTIRGLSASSGVGVNTIVRLEGGSNASMSVIRRLCQTLKVGPGALTGESFAIFDPDQPTVDK